MRVQGSESMEVLRLNLLVTLKHILDSEPKPLIHDAGTSNNTEGQGQKGRLNDGRKGNKQDPLGTRDSYLDLTGPPLITGVKYELWLHVFMGQLNWLNAPLYFSIILKVVILSFAWRRLMLGVFAKIFSMDLVTERDSKNPIFVFISFLAGLTVLVQIITNAYVNTFNLGNLFKILRTPKLCFIKSEVLHSIGNQTMGFVTFMVIYNGTLMSMIKMKNFDEFIANFDLVEYLIDTYCINVCIFNWIGVSLLDFYVRTSFGHWLLALRDHLEKQFAYLHHNPQILDGSIQGETLSNSASIPMKLITLDEIQRSLNNMDDHLEVMRHILWFPLVFMSLNSFLGNGALFLMTYHLIADQRNYYHGSILFFMALNYFLIVFSCYFGDSWLYYGLNSLVQCIEDEYFLQRDIKCPEQNRGMIEENDIKQEAPANEADEFPEYLRDPQSGISPSLKKKHVLFVREFLHQFENHLATPWSNLNFETHLHILRAFVTLVAAQIIFDHEH